MKVLTLSCTLIAKEKTGSLAETDGAESGGDDGTSWSKELLGLVDVVDTLAASSDMLRVDRTDGISSWTNTEDEWVLIVS